MEDRDFAWVCNVLANAGAKVPLQETFFYQKEEVSLWVASTRSGSVRRQLQPEEPLRTPSDVLHYFLSQRVHESPASPLLCVAVVKGQRIPVTEEKAEEAAALRGAFSRCSYMQKPLDERPTSLLHVLRVELQDNQYICWFLCRRTEEKPCKDQRLYYKLLANVKIVMRCVEMMRKRKVAQVELEFFVSPDGDVRLCGCPSCKLIAAVPSLPILPVIDAAAGSESPHRAQTATFEYRPFRPLPKRQPRFSTPAQFREEETAVIVPEPVELLSDLQTQESQWVTPKTVTSPKVPPASAATHSTFAKSARNVQTRGGSYYNQNFKEMLAKGYAKSIRCFPDDIEQMFQDFEAKMLKDEEPQPQRQRHSHAQFHRSDTGICAIPETPLTRAECRKPTVEVGRKSLPEGPFPLAKDHLPVQKTTTHRRRLKLPQSKTVSRLQKILNRYESEQRLSYLSSKYDSFLHRKNLSQPVTTELRKSLDNRPL